MKTPAPIHIFRPGKQTDISGTTLAFTEPMAKALASIKGKFLLSINDCPEIREVFKGFCLENVETTYTVRGQGSGAAAKELLVSNTKLKISRTRA